MNVAEKLQGLTYINTCDYSCSPLGQILVELAAEPGRSRVNKFDRVAWLTNWRAPAIEG